MPFDAPTLPTAHGARWSILVHDVSGDAVLYEHEPDLLLRTASVAKIFALAELAARIEDGTLAPDELLDRDSVDPVADSGLWQHLVSPRLPVADVATLIGAVSDNWATNVLVERLGLDRIQDVARTLAPGGSMLLDLVRNGRGPADPETLSVGCARDWTTVMAGAHRGELVDPEVSRRVLGWLACGADLSMVAGGLDLDPLVAHDGADGGITLAHKTGTDTAVRADIGLIGGPAATVAYAAICNWSPAADSVGRPGVLEAMRALGTAIASHVCGR